jgi:prevent-host-death family protein
MTYVSVDEIRRDLQVFLDRVEAGEAIVICQNNVPVAELRPLSCPTGEPRPFGLCTGEFTVPDDFDKPLPDETLSQFEGK